MTKKGVTLLELVVVAGIFAFAMCAILLLFISCATIDSANRNKSVATTHAETALEYARRLGFIAVRQNLCTGGGSWSLPLSTVNLSALDGEGPIVITTNSADFCTAHTLNLTAAVNWIDRSQAARGLTLGTIISE